MELNTIQFLQDAEIARRAPLDTLTLALVNEALKYTNSPSSWTASPNLTTFAALLHVAYARAGHAETDGYHSFRALANAAKEVNQANPATIAAKIKEIALKQGKQIKPFGDTTSVYPVL